MHTTRRVSIVLVAATVAVACAGSPGTSENSTDTNPGSGTNPSSGGNSTGSGGTGTNSSSGQTGSGTSTGPGNTGSTTGTSTSTSSSPSSSGTSGSSSSGGGMVATETVPGPTFVTTTQSAQFQTGTMTTVTSGTATLTVNDGTTFQTFSGFGGAFNEKGWSVISQLSASDQTKVMTLLFDWTNGAHFVIGRIPMGSSDYALARYTEDDLAAGQTDDTMANFSIAEDKKYLIPYVQAALAINSNIQLWSSPWTPPAWMKVNGSGSNSSGDTSAFDGGNMSNTASVLKAWALYEIKFVQAYAALGINISWIVPQNEPNYAQNYPSCLWTPATYDSYVGTYLGPMLASQSMSTQIYLGTNSCYSATEGPVTSNFPCTGNDPYSDTDVVRTLTTPSLDTAGAMKYIKGFAMQWNEITDVMNVTKFDMPLGQTEHRAGNVPFGGETTIVPVSGTVQNITFNSTMAPNDFNYALESYGLIGQWLQTGVTSYSAWNMVLDPVGKGLDMVRNWPQNALLTVDTSSSPAKLTITPAYYAFRHFSQFIVPGAVRVQVSGSSSLVANSYAFKNPDGSHAVIMYNGTSSAVQATASVGGKMIQFTVPANGFATLKT